MSTKNGAGDGAASPEALEAPPAAVAELAEACRRFVRTAIGVGLDGTPETLPLLDHYLAGRRAELRGQPEAAALVFRAAGAYFGEVLRRRHASWWSLPSDDPNDWEIQLREVYLSVRPVAVVYDAIFHGEGDGPIAVLEVEDEDREALEARLAELPPVSDEEYFSLSTRLEVVDIAVDGIKARMIEAGLGDVAFSPGDYGGDT